MRNFDHCKPKFVFFFSISGAFEWLSLIEHMNSLLCTDATSVMHDQFCKLIKL